MKKNIMILSGLLLIGLVSGCSSNGTSEVNEVTSSSVFSETETPTENQPSFVPVSEPISIPKTIDNEFESSLEAKESYAITQHSYHTENLPVISIHTENGTPVDDASLELGYNKGQHKDIMEYDYIGCTVDVTGCEGYEMESVPGQVKIRGNYTSSYEKRPLRIKFDKKQKMCGLNGDKKFKNWVLLAEYTDASLLKNTITQYLGKTMLGSDGEYSTDFRFAEVYLNDSYNGLYNLVEQQEVKSGRVDLPEALDPAENEDATEEQLKDAHIGYFLEYDGYYSNEPELQTFTLNYPTDEQDHYGNTITYNQPGFTIKNDLFYQEQNDYIHETMQAIADIVYDATSNSHNPVSAHPFYTLNDGKKVADPTIKTPREAIEKVIDVDSLLDIFFIEEIACDSDLDWSSFYMTIDMSSSGDHKLHYCAPWDFDNGFTATDQDSTFYTMKYTGTSSQGGGFFPGGGGFPGGGFDSAGTVSPKRAFREEAQWGVTTHTNANPWLMSFANQDWFFALAKAKWNAHKEAGTFDNVLKLIDDYSSAYADAYTRNAERWPSCYSTSNPFDSAAASTSKPSEKIATIRNWTVNRISAIDKLLNA